MSKSGRVWLGVTGAIFAGIAAVQWWPRETGPVAARSAVAGENGETAKEAEAADRAVETPGAVAQRPVDAEPDVRAAPPVAGSRAPGVSVGADTSPDSQKARHVMDDLQFVLRDYRTAVGGNPVGTNAEITGALLGNNIGQVKVALPDGTTVNGLGEMCDPWGTPYFFHQLSATRMEIRSAGPDRRMWTEDDVAM